MNFATFYYRCRRKLAHLCRDPGGVARWSNQIASGKTISVLRKEFNEEVLPSISVEITTDCNYRCKFCPQSTCQRESKYITRPDFQLIVEVLKNVEFSNDIILSVNNEPFMHPLLIDFCEQVASGLPGAKIVLISNGSLIERNHMRFLSDLAISVRLLIDDYTEEHHIAKRIEQWNSELSKPLSLTTALRKRDEMLSNRAGNQPGGSSRMEDYQQVVCTWPFMGMFINADLKVFLCCSDYQHEIILGDLRTQCIKEIWQGDGYREIRRKLLTTQRKNLVLCTRCDAEWFALPSYFSDARS